MLTILNKNRERKMFTDLENYAPGKLKLIFIRYYRIHVIN
jgi:hypothetical protein